MIEYVCDKCGKHVSTSETYGPGVLVREQDISTGAEQWVMGKPLIHCWEDIQLTILPTTQYPTFYDGDQVCGDQVCGECVGRGLVDLVRGKYILLLTEVFEEWSENERRRAADEHRPGENESGESTGAGSDVPDVRPEGEVHESGADDGTDDVVAPIHWGDEWTREEGCVCTYTSPILYPHRSCPIHSSW